MSSAEYCKVVFVFMTNIRQSDTIIRRTCRNKSNTSFRYRAGNY